MKTFGEKINKQEVSGSRSRKITNAIAVASEVDLLDSDGGEVLRNGPRAIDKVRDHFPDSISPKEHFEEDGEAGQLETEDDYREAFDMFTQEVGIAVPTEQNRHEYKIKIEIQPTQKTVHEYLKLVTEKTIPYLANGAERLPKTDVAIFLDKSARPVSWFVDELWEDVTDNPKPEIAHLCLDRKYWANKFGIELTAGEYTRNGTPLTWNEFPIHDVRPEEILELSQLLKDKIITHSELDAIIKGDTEIERRKVGELIDAALNDDNIKDKIRQGALTRKELESIINESKERVKILFNKERIKNIGDAFMIAMSLRGLFVPNGLSEEDLVNPERIMDYPTGMDGKNITIIDEVERTGTTAKLAQCFVSWAFPEAKSVNFHCFYTAERLHDPYSPQDGQMLKIPFWYKLMSDTGAGRGILDPDKNYYAGLYENESSMYNRALLFGSEFLAVPMTYELEESKQSLRLRSQIARLRVEYEKGHIK